MTRFFMALVVLGGWAFIAGPVSGQAPEPPVREGAETAANVVEAILSGRDDPAAWGALETALGRGLPDVQRGPTAMGVDPGDTAPPESRQAKVALTVFGSTVRLPVWMQSMEAQRIVAGIVAAVLALLIIFAGWQSFRLTARAFRVVTRGGRGRRTLVRRRPGDLPRSRDAERLHAQLRARRAA